MPHFLIAAPTASSLKYAAAVSIRRYPAEIALMTACSHSAASGTWNTPKPSIGIFTPLFKVTNSIIIPPAI